MKRSTEISSGLSSAASNSSGRSSTMFIVRVMYDGGRLRLELDPSTSLSQVLDQVVSRAPHYERGFFKRELPHENNLDRVSLDTPISECLEHGEMIFACTPSNDTPDAEPGTPPIQNDNSHHHHEDINQEDAHQPLLQEDSSPQPPSMPSSPIAEDVNHNSDGPPNHEDGGDEAMCRICHSGVEVEHISGRLISPCLCNGSVRFVHIECLNEWRRLSVNPRSYYECEQCQYRYSLKRARWAQLLLSSRFVAISSAIVCLLLTLLIAYPLQLIVPFLVDMPASTVLFRVSRFSPRWHRWRTGAWGFIAEMLNFVAAGVGGLGCVGFGMYTYDEYLRHREDGDGLFYLARSGMWLASMSNDRLARLAVIVGVCVAYRSVFERVRTVATAWSQKYGERILQVQQQRNASD